ncbi:MAG: thymidylate synthase [Candidatus Bathyarchaeota archaeon B63]|nr:MAG: thymidylate synthase [Candidatus Bathyarchaeota archaeon B63]
MVGSSLGIVISAKTISEAWERAVIECWRRGAEVPTEYGEMSREILGLMIVVESPFEEPRIHRGDINIAVKGTIQKYYDEVLHGTLDWAVEDGKIHYTYHERLFKYPQGSINQIEYIIEKLRDRSFSRRAQAITWIPKVDMWVESPPCLQRVWCTVRDDRLIMHTAWRSRDIFRAMHMNMLAMTELQRRIAEQLGLEVGAYLDFSNSAHIYERSYGDVERFIRVVQRRLSRR